MRSYTYDAAGHTEGYGSLSFTYNNRGRMEATSASSTDYLYNALGQMIEKSGTLGTTTFMQDESGHLIGEYDGSGNLIEETIWLRDIPVATLQPNGSGGVNIFYIHTDHLNAPRKVQQPVTDALAWRWDTDPFGTAAPNENPSGLGTFPYNLRFPGQYYDAETGLSQNWNRDYDPVVGRYIESDLIGLYGGINTYAYVYDDPVGAFDPEGLVKRGDGWSNPQWVRIKAAEATIRQEASKSCSCSGGSCIPCELVPRLLDKLNNSEIVEAPLGGDCGFAGPGYRVFLSPVAFTKRCDCLASTMYHELLHNAGLEHYATPAGPGIEDLEKRCLGHLCKGSSQ